MKIFLDIDGVMVHANPQKQLDFEEDGFYRFSELSVHILQSFIDPLNDELILSTTHRFRYSIAEWKNIFNVRGIFVNEVSIVNLPVNPKYSRKNEIMDWISMN
ncbi:HAD domain-containing protein [Mucilaginibacter sp. JRF]|uniref:HAD domain-containing protein n=1 Tax=Mucilaginibacter sp. JRF TaxID=2780088 RepID=UPI003221DDE0